MIKTLKRSLKTFFVVINEEEVSISSLVLEKKASFKWVGQNLHLKISDVSKILDFPPSSQALVKLKISTPKKSDFNGIKWVKESGRDGKRACFINLQAYAHKNNIPISVDSIFYDEWKNFVRWDLVTQGASGAKEYYLDHTMDLSVVINNYFN